MREIEEKRCGMWEYPIIESFLEAPFANTNAKIQSFCSKYKNLISYDAKHRYPTEEEKVTTA